MGLIGWGRAPGRCRTRWLVLVGCSLLIPWSAPAETRIGGLNGTISQDVVGSGGGPMSAGTLSLNGTAGQAAVGFSSGGAATLSHGVYVTPQAAVCDSTGPTVIVNIGEAVCLSLPSACPVSATDPMYQWFRQGDPLALVDLPGVVTGVDTDTLCFASADTSDSGVYVLMYLDNAEAPAQFSVELMVVSAVPVSGWAVLSACAFLIALALFRRLPNKQRVSAR